jgi:hypothetical protein
MVLSNPRPFFLLAALCGLFFQACGRAPADSNKPIVPPDQVKSEFPFPTREPDIYQADIFTSDGRVESRVFVARKGTKWRYDHFAGGRPSRSMIFNGQLVRVDHVRKTYYAEPAGPASDAADLDPAAFNLFRGRDYRQIEEVGRSDGLITYKARDAKDLKTEILLTFDEASGLIVREEFKDRTEDAAGFLFELRNLKTDVDDSVFETPAGYRSVARDELIPKAKQHE